jgi:hypothetical protein
MISRRSFSLGRVGLLRAICLFTVIGIAAATATWRPLLVPPDGIDYIDGASLWLQTGSLDGFETYKAPGITFLVAGAMAIDPSIRALLWLQGAAVVGTALFVWAALRPEIGETWATLAATLIGLHPILLTYQTYILRESFAAALTALLCWQLLRQAAAPYGMWRAAALGVIVAVAALMRENFLGLVVLVPLVLAFFAVVSRETLRMRLQDLIPAAIAAVVALACLSPWMAYMQARTGHYAITVPKTQFNRAINAWGNGLIDAGEHGLRAASDYHFIAQRLVAEGVIPAAEFDRSAVDAVVKALSSSATRVEEVCRSLVANAIVARPGKALSDASWAFVSQVGLWNLTWHPNAGGNAWHALPLRSEPPLFQTNYIPDIDAILATGRLSSHRERWERILAETRHTISSPSTRLFTSAFDVAFSFFERIRPAVALLFVCGLVVSVRTRRWGIAALGGIALVNYLGAAWMMTPLDRFAVGLLPMQWIVAASGAWTLAGSLSGLSRAAQERGRGRVHDGGGVLDYGADVRDGGALRPPGEPAEARRSGHFEVGGASAA